MKQMQVSQHQDRTTNGGLGKPHLDGNGKGGKAVGGGGGNRHNDVSSTTLFDVKIGMGMDIDIQGENNGESMFEERRTN